MVAVFWGSGNENPQKIRSAGWLEWMDFDIGAQGRCVHGGRVKMLVTHCEERGVGHGPDAGLTHGPSPAVTPSLFQVQGQTCPPPKVCGAKPRVPCSPLQRPVNHPARDVVPYANSIPNPGQRKKILIFKALHNGTYRYIRLNSPEIRTPGPKQSGLPDCCAWQRTSQWGLS